jgi:hypothetical protein
MRKVENSELVIVGNEKLMLTDILTRYTAGKFRMVVKTNLGMTVCDARDFENPRMMKNPECIISGYKKGVYIQWNSNLRDMLIG